MVRRALPVSVSRRLRARRRALCWLRLYGRQLGGRGCGRPAIALGRHSVYERISTHLLLVVQALVVVLENGHALCLAAVVLGVCVGHVAREDFLPEGEAARGACAGSSVKAMLPIVIPGSEQEAAVEGAA